ncbi:atrial natriuretic peptide-converting enzyme [Trichonephila clavipes]|nr:atrial natriuretic peptide-converting enzyme [Trichonephila clavipes]
MWNVTDWQKVVFSDESRFVWGTDDNRVRERLDHLAFTSFPEDYLPYASGHRTGKAPPYLVWEERRPRRRRGCCSTAALVSAVALVVAAILAVVAVSVYLGVVTNLFRSPVLSLSGKFRVSQGDEFVEELLNTTSKQFLKKADNYQTMVENVFLSSSLEPAFIAARIYAFRPNLLVFFRLYLDRRKLQQDDSDVLKKVKTLIGSESPSFGALTIDRESVDVDENEEWISIPGAGQSTTPRLPPRLATAPPIKRKEGPKSGNQGEVAGVGSIKPEEDNLHKFSYGQWKPVPIEDSVSPSFGDQRTPPGRGNARFPEPNRRFPNPPAPSNPPLTSNPSHPPLTSNPSHPPLPSGPSNPLHVGVGSVSVLEDPLSHIDPVPIPTRNGRPLLLQGSPPQRGEVASSIMSSVSLVVRPPTNSSRNRTSGHLDRGEHPFRHSLKSDQPSYRFLDEGAIGEGLVRLEPEPLEGEDSSGSVISEDSSLVRNAPQQDALRTLSTADSSESTTVDLTALGGSSSTSSEFVSSETVENFVSILPNTHLKESSVEYASSEMVELESSTEIQTVYKDNSTDSSEMLTNPESRFTPSMPIRDASKDNVSNIVIQPSPNSSKVTNNDEAISLGFTDIIHKSSKFDNETELNIRNVLHIYSAQSDIGLKYQNYSVEESNISSDEAKESTTTSSTNPSDLEEANSEMTPSSVQTKYINTEENATEILSATFPKRGNVSEIISTDFPSIFRSDESAEFDTTNTNFFISTVKFEISSSVNESIAPTEYPYTTSEVTKSQTYPTILDHNLSSLHIQPELSLKFKNLEDISELSVLSSDIEESQNETNNLTFPEIQTTQNVSVSTSSDEFSLHITNTIPPTSNASNDSFVPKIVPQQSDVSFEGNDIDENDDSEDDLNEEDPLGVEIIRHITTLPPTPVSLGKHPVFVSEKCAEDEFQCASGECVYSAGRCNMRRDCRDNSDEKQCPCSELLKVMGQSQKICDGVEDCEDHSDEQNCPWCEEGQMVCPQTKFCINQSQVCDGHNDCPSGVDERYCVKLAENADDALGLHHRAQGFLMVRKEGSWGKLCLDNLLDSRALRRKLDELGEAVCSALTFRSVSDSQRTRDAKDSNDTYYVISNQVPSQNKRSSAIFSTSECDSREVMRVQCRDLECGMRPMSSGPRRRIVGGQSAGAGSWPWQVALYKEGDFQCGAVLISDTWLISAGHCFYSTQNAHWMARLGLLRRGTELSAPSEQVRRVIQIFLHPEYEDKGFINDIALLRMDKPVLFSDYLRPVCLPTAQEDAGLWHGRHCSVVGWGKLYEIGHTFPDSLQEVRLPVISTEECRKRILFLTMYHITDNMFCAGYERGGRDACLGDSGGPLMCQREDGRWLLLGVTSNGDGCGRPKRPGVYTKVANYLAWIKQVTEGEHAVPAAPDRCEGVRCRLGRCVAPYKVCDGRWDCSEGRDEDRCFGQE